MTPPPLTLADALARLAEGRIVPTCKYVTLQKRGYIKVRGHGCKSKPVLTESGRELLTVCASGAGG